MPEPTQELLSERGKTHGDFSVHSRITQQIKLAMRDTPNWQGLSHSQQESLDMLAHKIGRVLAGNPDHLDHWDDMAGYSTLVANEIRKAASYLGTREVA